MTVFLHDLRYAFRAALKQPGFAAVVLVTLALGIGANTAVFTVLNGIVLKPLPFDEPGQLIIIDESVQPAGISRPIHGVTLSEIEELGTQTDILAEIGGFESETFTLIRDGQPERLIGAHVTSGFFRALGVKPAAGRFFGEEADVRGAQAVVVLTHGLWQRRFGGDADLIGTSLILNDTSYVVRGILPVGFDFPVRISGAEVFTALPNESGNYDAPGWRTLWAVGRLENSVERESVQAHFDTIAARFEREDPDRRGGCKIVAESLHERVVGNTRPLLLLLFGAVGLVLLIACANVANLFLVRGADRQRELAVRAAVGAARGRLVRQMLTESLLVGVAGGLLGLLVASWGVDALIAALPDEIPRTDEVSVDGRVLCFALCVSILTSVLFGLPSALKGTRVELHAMLKEGGRAGAGPGRHVLQKSLVVSELAMAIVLLVGAGLLLRSFDRLMNVEFGFVPDKVLSFRMLIDRPVDQRAAFCAQVTERLEGLPGVRSVGVSDRMPLTEAGWRTSFDIVGRPQPESAAGPIIGLSAVNSDYFTTMGIPLLRGRMFNDGDTSDRAGVAIINQVMAEQYLPGRDPLGERIKVGASIGDLPSEFEIIGVVASVKDRTLDSDASPRTYVPYELHPRGFVSFAMKTAGDPVDLIDAVRSEVASLTQHEAPYAFTTLKQYVAKSVAKRRFPMLLLGISAGVALTLASVGIYGMIAYVVSRRTHEIGVRMAIGAQRHDVFRLVLRQGLVLIAIGLTIGLAVSLASTRVLSNLLYETGPADPLTFVGVGVLLTCVALTACYIPARRATRVDPIVALRCE